MISFSHIEIAELAAVVTNLFYIVLFFATFIQYPMGTIFHFVAFVSFDNTVSVKKGHTSSMFCGFNLSKLIQPDRNRS